MIASPRVGDRGGRAFVLLAMLVAIGAAMIVTGAVVWAARSEHAGRTASTDSIRRRAAAWSAAQAVAAELGSQRHLVLTGGAPTLLPQLLLYEDGAAVAVVRLIPAAADGRQLVPEAGLLDANGADAEALNAAGLDDEVAALVVAARSGAGGVLASLEPIVDRPGVAPSLLRGESAFDSETMAIIRGVRGGEQGRALAGAGSALEKAGSALDAAGSRMRGRDATAGEGVGDDDDGTPDGPAPGDASGGGGPAPPVGSRSVALADRLSVFAVEPALTRTGERRLPIDESWPELLRDRLGGQLDATRRRRLDGLVKEGAKIESDRALVELLATLGVEPAHWGDLLDAVTAEPGLWRWGRIDINHAEPEVLAAIPQLSAEQVARLVRTREALDPSERSNPAWPVVRGIVEPQSFAALLPAITTRSFFWRVRFVSGFAEEEDPDGPMSGITIMECVIDLTSERPRIAALRDLSLAPALGRLMAERASSDDGGIGPVDGDASTAGIGGDPDPDPDAPNPDGEAGEAAESPDDPAAVAPAPTPRAGTGSRADRRAPGSGARGAHDASSADSADSADSAPTRGSSRAAGRARPSDRPGSRESAATETPGGESSSDARGSRDSRDRRRSRDSTTGESREGAAVAGERPGSPPPVGRYRPRPGRADRAPASEEGGRSS